MKLTLDTRDNPRLTRAAIAMLLAALDDGSALPVNTPAGLVLRDNEKEPDPREAFGGAAAPAPLPPVPPAPSTVAAPPPPPAPVVPPVTSAPPPPASTVHAPPPAPVAPPAPSAPVPPAPPALAGSTVALDTKGLPWDARIHAATKSKVADGSWKKKKGTPPETVAAVEAELRATMAIPGPVGTVIATPAPSTTVYVPPPPPAASPSVPMPPVGAVPALDADPTNFAQFMAWIAGLISAGKWSHAQTSTALGSMGLPGAVALSTRPDLIPTAVATIRAMIPAA